MADKPLSVQDRFLNSVRRSKSPVTIFLVKGVKLQGVITWFDAFSLLLRRETASQLIYKHAISTIVPARPLADLAGEGGQATQLGRGSLQDLFLAAAGREEQPISLFLINGVMLQGSVTNFDQFSILLERPGQVQLIYKHAISTLQPAQPLDLEGKETSADEDGGA